jgi:hypothetical protein
MLLAAAALAADWIVANRFYAPREGADVALGAAATFAEAADPGPAPPLPSPPISTGPPPLPPVFREDA